MFYKFLTICCLLLSLQIKAQDGNWSLSPLKIGDRVPESIWKSIPKSDSTQLIILDQWETSCSSCIVAFPKMEALKNTIGSKLLVVLITRNSLSEIESKPAIKRRLPALPSFYDDKQWSILFPYAMVPQHIWLDQNGIVKAITDGGNATEKNVRQYLQNVPLNLRQKKDILAFNYDHPLFAGNDLPVGQLQYYSILLKGRVDLSSRNTYRRTNGIVHGQSITNASLSDLYNRAVYNLLPGYNSKRFILDVAYPDSLIINSDDPTEISSKLFSYDFIVPLDQADKLYELMLADLNRFSGYIGRIEKRKIKCFVLVRKSKKDKIAAQKEQKKENNLFDYENPVIINSSINAMVARISDLPFIELPIIDETSYKGNISIQFKGTIDNVRTLRKELQRFDLDLREVTRKLDVFILSTKRNMK